MTTLDELTPKTLSLDDVGRATAAMSHAARCRFVEMYNAVMDLPPTVAGELAFTTHILHLTLQHRAAMREHVGGGGS